MNEADVKIYWFTEIPRIQMERHALRLEEDILTDHAYCEQKAATSCILIQNIQIGNGWLPNSLNCNRRVGAFSSCWLNCKRKPPQTTKR